MMCNGLVSRMVGTKGLTVQSTMLAAPTVEALSVRGDVFYQNMLPKLGFKEGPKLQLCPDSHRQYVGNTYSRKQCLQLACCVATR